MKTVIAALSFVLLAFHAAPAGAEDWRLGDLVVSDAWARSTPGMAKTGAVYLTIANHGASADRLVAAATPAAGKAELHTHSMDGNVMRMRPIAAVEVSPGEPSVMRPGGTHVMLTGLARPLAEGEVFPMTLSFEKAGTVEVRVRVMKIGSMGPGSHDHHQGEGHHPPAGQHHHGM